jgi:hypothetical protein
MRAQLPYFLFPFFALINFAILTPNEAWSQVDAYSSANSKEGGTKMIKQDDKVERREGPKDPGVPPDKEPDGKYPGAGDETEPAVPAEVEPEPNQEPAGSLMVGNFEEYSSPMWNDKEAYTSVPAHSNGFNSGSGPSNTGLEPAPEPTPQPTLEELSTNCPPDVGKASLDSILGIDEATVTLTLGSELYVSDKKPDMYLGKFR